MASETRWTFALLGGAVVLIVVSAYLLLTQAGALTESRRKLEVVNARLATASAALEKASLENAIRVSNNLYLDDTSVASNDFIDDISQSIKQLCPRSGRRQLDANVVNFCFRFANDAELLKRLNSAAYARASSETASEFAEVERRYQRMLDHLRGLQSDAWMNDWVARGKEGIAYSYLRRGMLAEAEGVAAESKRLGPDSAFVRTTPLKIACAKKANASDIASELQDVRRHLDSIVSRRRDLDPNGRMLRNALNERQIVERDVELFTRCRYVGIKPRKLAGEDDKLLLSDV